jgi:hypothetical protein
VIIDFPSNLAGTDQIVNILTDATSEETTIKLDETLASAGLITHIDDSVPNPASGTGTYFKHQAKYLAVDNKTLDINGNIKSTSTSDLQSYIENVIQKSYTSVINTANNTQYISTLAKIIQELVRCSSTNFDFSNLT